MQHSIVTVFGSAKPMEKTPEYEIAYEVGKRLATEGFVVCNGGYGGTMEASARGAKDTGGSTIGIIAKQLSLQANAFIDNKIVVKTHLERLMKLIELGDAYIALRGGTGTLVELATVWEYMNKGTIPEKPFIAVGDFWSKVIETMKEELTWEGKANAAAYVLTVSTAEECVAILSKKLQQT